MADGEVDEVLKHYPETVTFKKWNEDPHCVTHYRVSWDGLNPETGKPWPDSEEPRKNVDKLSVAQYWYKYLLKNKPNSNQVNKLIKFTSIDNPPEVEYVFIDHLKVKGFKRDNLGRAGFDLKNLRTQTNYFLPITHMKDTTELQVKLKDKLNAFMEKLETKNNKKK